MLVGLRASNRDKSGVMVRDGTCCDFKTPTEGPATPANGEAVGAVGLGVDQENEGALG